MEQIIPKDILKPLHLQRDRSVDKNFALGWHQLLCQEADLVPPWTHTFCSRQGPSTLFLD
jgi:hypothetical protein